MTFGLVVQVATVGFAPLTQQMEKSLGSVYPGLVNDAAASASPLAALMVDSTGRLLATQHTQSCDPTGYLNVNLLTGTTSEKLPGFHVYPHFSNANYLAGDSQGRTYISNEDADIVSVVAGAPSEVVGYLIVDRPGPLAISGSSLYVVSDGRITKRSPLTTFCQWKQVEILSQTLHGASSLSSTRATIRVVAAFSPVIAHNVLYYNGIRFFPAETS